MVETLKKEEQDRAFPKIFHLSVFYTTNQRLQLFCPVKKVGNATYNFFNLQPH